MKKRIDKRLFLILIGYMAAYHVVYILRRIILKAIARPEYVDLSWWETIFQPIFANFIVVPPVIILILWVTHFMMEKKLPWIYVFPIHFVLSFLYSMILTVFSHFYGFVVLHGSYEFTFDNLLVRTLFGSNLNFLGYVGFVTIIYSYTYVQKISKAELQRVELSRQLQNVKMQALKSQLNPHFLFNTLNAISSLIKEDQRKAQRMLGNLGDLLREILLVKDENLISVEQEMLLLNRYLDIMKTRFSEDLTVTTEIEEDVKEALIPSMLIQPIIENSIKYGYSYESTDLKVDLRIFRRDGNICLEIKNNGPRISGDKRLEGLGIANIKERLTTQFDDRFTFSFSNVEEGPGVKTTMVLPLILADGN